MEYLTVYLIGASAYAGIELLWRGWTHWSMLLCGGACFLVMYLISAMSLPFWEKCLLCAVNITVIELVTGILVNIILGWHVWDYSDRSFNVLGQICPLYCFFWLLLSVPGVKLCSLLHRGLN